MANPRLALRLCFIIVLSGYAMGQNLVELRWKFQPGDNLEWAKPEFDDTGWPLLITGRTWEQQGYAQLDGFAWYRTSVVIPSTLKAEATKRGGFSLRLGRIDDSDATYFNGELIGQSGDFPPNYLCAYSTDRNYLIAVDKVRWDLPNVIAVRVYDGGGGGGMYTTPAEMTVIGVSDQLRIEIALKEKDHVLKNFKGIKLPVILHNASEETLQGKMSIEIKSDFGVTIATQEQYISVANQSNRTFLFNLENLPAGFYLGQANFECPGWNKFHKFAFAIDPEKVQSPVDAQPDFDEFWQHARAELAQVDPQFKIVRIDSLCTSQRDYFLVEMRSLDQVRVRGWYSVPRKPGKYPAILQVQGYGTVMTANNLESSPDFVSFGLNIRGHGNSKEDVNPGFPGYLQYNLQDKHRYIYRGAYMDCIRAVDFLCSRPEVDVNRIVVEGQSQGGALAIATAALDNERIRLCVTGVPFLSDFPDYFKIAVWPGNEFKQYVAEHPETNWQEVFQTLSYFDIKNLAPRIKCPVLMLCGLMDDVCPPHINFAAYNNLHGPKSYIVYPYSGHGLPAENYHARMAWIRQQLQLQ